MKYSISDIANFLGISIVAVRNYEKYGLIEPQRNEQNNYREYHAIDLNIIRRARSYMSYGFSLAEATDMIVHGDLNKVGAELEKKEADIEKKMMFDYQLLMFTKRHAEYLKRISVGEGECAVEMSPAFYGFTFRENAQFLEDRRLKQRAQKWNDIRPFVETFIILKKSCFEELKMRDKAGLCIEERYAAFFSIEADECVKYYPARKAIHTIIRHTYEPDINYDHFEFDFVTEWARRRGFRIVDDAFGRVLHSTKASGKWQHYMEIWVPIE